MTAVSGMLVEGHGSGRPVEGAKIRIRFRYAEGLETFTSDPPAVTDGQGGFVAVVHDGRPGAAQNDVAPDQDRGRPGWFAAELEIERAGVARSAQPPPLRLGRLTRIERPLEWAALRRAERPPE
jgi:hypothetical protein